MSNANDPGSAESTREALGRLAGGCADSPQAEATQVPAPAPASRWTRTKLYAKRTALVMALLVLVACFGVAGIYLRNPTIRSIVLSLLRNPRDVIKDGRIDPTGYYSIDRFPADKRKSITVLMLGSDHDSARGVRIHGEAFPVDVPSGPGRSDSVMVARFEFDGDAVRSINVLSIPRDTRVRVPGYGIHKINAAHAYGGPELTCATVREVFGIEPDYYIDLNFEGFQQLVDAVGGVDINVDRRLEYYDDWAKLYIDLKPGMQHLNGYKAMGFVRFRHTRTKSGKPGDAAQRASETDIVRAQRQHVFLEALRDRVTSPAAFLSLPNAVSAITNNIHSNLTMEQMLSLANLSRKAPKDVICLETLPVIEGRTFVYIDRRKSAGVIHKMFFKDKQIAEGDIKTPESDTEPVHHRKRHVRESGAAAEGSRNPETDAGDGAPNAAETSDPDPVRRPETSPGKEVPATPRANEKPSAPAPGDSNEPGRTQGSDGGKPSENDGDGTSTSAQSAPPVARV